MVLDGDAGNFFESLSTGKQGTSVLIRKIQQELENSSIGNLSEYQKNGDLASSFTKWKMKYYDEVNILLALIDQEDKESVFFMKYISKSLRNELLSFRKRLHDILSSRIKM